MSACSSMQKKHGTLASPVRNNLSVKGTPPSTTKLASNNLYPAVVCVNIPAKPHTNLNHTYPIGPVRNPLQPYNQIAAVQAALPWTSRASTNKQLSSFHKKSDRTARVNYNMPSSRRQTQPRSANPVVGSIHERLATMRYNASRGACKVPLKQLGATIKVAVSAGYLRQLSRDNHRDQKILRLFEKDRRRQSTGNIPGANYTNTVRTITILPHQD